MHDDLTPFFFLLKVHFALRPLTRAVTHWEMFVLWTFIHTSHSECWWKEPWLPPMAFAISWVSEVFTISLSQPNQLKNIKDFKIPGKLKHFWYVFPRLVLAMEEHSMVPLFKTYVISFSRIHRFCIITTYSWGTFIYIHTYICICIDLHIYVFILLLFWYDIK